MKCHLLGVALLGAKYFTYLMKIRHPNLIKIGEQIRLLRTSQNYSQEAFAAITGLGRTYMGRVERGEQNISIQNLIKIAMVLNVEVGELIPSLTKLQMPLNRASET